MQRYHAASCTSAVNKSAIGGPSARETSRPDLYTVPPNSLNSRRPSQLVPYKIRCDKEPLNSRLGPPDFHPPTPNCPEETLTREYAQSGYRETVEGLEESRETSLSQVQTFTKAVILKSREEVKRYYRAINESRAQKRKAGQVYGVPLSGTLLSKPGIFPEQRPSGEEFRKKWIEGLSQQHKRLRSMADHVPHGYRKKSLFEVLIRNNVPLLRATWFIKVTYLNQIRPGSSSISSGVPDKTQFSRSEQWTKDLIEYLQILLDEFVSRNNSYSTLNIRDRRSPQMVYSGSMQYRNDSASVAVDGDEPSLYLKWLYVVRILQWHHAEGLLIPSLVIDWVLNQLQEKELLGVLQLLLPIIYGVIETIVLSQTYVRMLVGIAVRFIREPSPGGSDLVDNSRRAYTISALVEMLRYLILAVPDTFVALDCFPLPSIVVTHGVNDGNFMSKVADNSRKDNHGPLDVSSMLRDKGHENLSDTMSIDSVVSSIQKRAENLARATRPGNEGQNMAKLLVELDKTLVHGDLREAYRCVFENLSDVAVEEHWITEVSSYLRSSLKYIGTVSSSFISSVFFICEWATCDFRDFRTGPPHGLKFTGRKDLSQIYIAVRLLKLRLRDTQGLIRRTDDNIAYNLSRDPNLLKNPSGRNFGLEGLGNLKPKSVEVKLKNVADTFESPGPLHDIIVCWIDQHEVQNGEGFKRLLLLLVELIRAGIFYPQVYVRQLIVSGIMDMNESSVDLASRKRHYKLLKQLPSPYIRDALTEAQIAQPQTVSEVITVYSNERRLLLDRLLDNYENCSVAYSSYHKKKHHRSLAGDRVSPSSVDEFRYLQSASSSSIRNIKRNVELEDLKSSISLVLQFPWSSVSTDAGLGGSQVGVKNYVSSGGSKIDQVESSSSCKECRRSKRQKLSEERSLQLQGYVPNPSDEEDFWWTRKGPKFMESSKADPPPKAAKQASRGRQKSVRKTQSLAQLAATRIEGSQGASTSHVCDSRGNCPHHTAGVDGDFSNSAGGNRVPRCADIVSIGKVLKQLRFVEKNAIVVWLIAVVKQLVEEAEKVSSGQEAGHYGRPSIAINDQNSARWKLGEDEFSAVLYLMDVCNELVSAVKFLLWLLPKVLRSPGSSIHGARNFLMLPRNVGNLPCEVGEGFLLSSIRRYENTIVAADLIPETLSAMMSRAAATMTPNARISASPALMYARHLLKKYGNIASVVEWEKRFKLTCDKRVVSELESGRLLNGDIGFPLGVPAGVEDLDDFFRRKISGRVSRVGSSMRDIVQRHFDESFSYYNEKERKTFGPNSMRSPNLENSDDIYQMAQQIVMGLMECMHQTGGAAQEGDPNLVSSAISAIVGNVGQAMEKIPELTVSSNQLTFSSSTSSLNFARRIFRIHLTCLCLLKDALGERQSRVFEVALASESSSILAQIFAPPKVPRSQFQPSPESQDSTMNLSNDISNNFTRIFLGKAAKVAAVSALIVGAILHGITNLERMVTLFKLKEGLDLVQFVRNMKSNSNGTRSIGTSKVDNSVEVSVHWFRVLVGNCRTIADGFIVDLLGEPAVVALSRMQRTLPQNLVFPPAYSIFTFVLWRPFMLGSSVGARDDICQLYQSLALAIGDAVKHLPFREVCLRDTYGLHNLMVEDTVDSNFAAMIEANGLDMHLKATAFVPLRSRLFLNALIDCKLHQSLLKQDESKFYHAEKETNLLNKLVHVLDTLQPAKFHWQWVELRLLLDEQAITERLEAETSLVEAIRYPEKTAASENENNFIEILLTRLLVRPDAAPLFSEVVHLLGRSLEDSMLLQVKWFLGGQDVLYGRKSIRQRLMNIAESKGLLTKVQYWKPWGWCYSASDAISSKAKKRKSEISSLEEGEVVDEGPEAKRAGRGATQAVNVERFDVSQHVTERALIELVLPCMDKGSDDSRNSFASDMIKQMNNIEQQINAVTRGANKSTPTASSGLESPVSKGNGRKGIRGGSPGLARRSTASAETVPPSPAALRASMSLRVQFLLRLLPIICADREPSARNMRHVLASVILRLLGSRVVQEDAWHSFSPSWNLVKQEVDPFYAPALILGGESLFDRLLLLLHGLLSNYQPSWLKPQSLSKSSIDCRKDFFVFDREVVESLQNDLDHMHLPEPVRWRIQTAMPILSPSVRWLISCQPPSVSPAALAVLQPSNPIYVVQAGNTNLPQRNPSLGRSATSVAGKSKPFPVQQELDLEVDPWTLLEDGAGSGQSSSSSLTVGGSDLANTRASNWLKGAVRVRRSDLTYIGEVDEGS